MVSQKVVGARRRCSSTEPVGSLVNLSKRSPAVALGSCAPTSPTLSSLFSSSNRILVHNSDGSVSASPAVHDSFMLLSLSSMSSGSILPALGESLSAVHELSASIGSFAFNGFLRSLSAPGDISGFSLPPGYTLPLANSSSFASAFSAAAISALSSGPVSPLACDASPARASSISSVYDWSLEFNTPPASPSRGSDHFLCLPSPQWAESSGVLSPTPAPPSSANSSTSAWFSGATLVSKDITLSEPRSHPDLQPNAILGHGAYGTVYLATHAESDMNYAVKVISKSKFVDDSKGDATTFMSAMKQVTKEQKAMRILDESGRSGFLPLCASWHDSRNFYLVTVSAGVCCLLARCLIVCARSRTASKGISNRRSYTGASRRCLDP